MGRAAGTCRRIVELTRPGFRVGHEFGHALGRHTRVDDHDVAGVANVGSTHKILDRVVVQF